MAARQAGDMYSLSDVRVIESKSIGDGYAALQMLDLSSDNPDEIAQAMTDAMADVVCGMVTHAVRDANITGVEIHENDYIGFEGKTMYSAAADKVDAASELLKKLNADRKEFLILIHGKDATPDDRTRVSAAVSAICPNLEVYEIDGGQDVYDFLLILQ